MSTIIDRIMFFFAVFIFIYTCLAILTYTFMLVSAFVNLRREYHLDKRELDEKYIDDFYAKPISIIVPAYNEASGIVDSVRSLLSLRYPQTELIVVNDGSTDQTHEILIKQFQMEKINRGINQQINTQVVKAIYRSEIHHNLYLIDKENGGKADALNAGINLSRFPYFCSIDGDSVLDEKSLLRVMKPIISSDEKVIAAGGNIRIANGTSVHLGSVDYPIDLSNNVLVVMQRIEYVRAFIMGRVALSRFNLMLIISGAFSVFSKKWVIKVGGYSVGMIGEDMELVVKLQRYVKEEKLDKRIEFVSDPICYTEVPEKLSDLRKQRRRWHQGLVDTLWKHKKMIFNPKYGKIGLISLPYFLLIECFGPVIELGGYFYLIIAYFFGQVYVEFALIFVLLFILYGSIFSAASIILESWTMNTYTKPKDFLKLMLMSLSETFWYRPLTLFWRCEGFISSLRKNSDWGSMTRQGFKREGEAE